MFVIRYLIAALATIVAVLIGGDAMGYSLWQSAGMSFLAMVLLQVVILGYVIVVAIRSTRASRDVPPKDARKPRSQLFILPK